MRCFEQSLYASNLIYQWNVRQKRVHRWPRRLGKVCTAERVGIVEVLNPILHGGHVCVVNMRQTFL